MFLRKFTRSDWDCWAGAEMIDKRTEPLIAEKPIKIDGIPFSSSYDEGDKTEGILIIDGTGITINVSAFVGDSGINNEGFYHMDIPPRAAEILLAYQPYEFTHEHLLYLGFEWNDII